MACIVKQRSNGRLFFRLFWDGYRSWEGTGIRATDKGADKVRRKMENKAEVMSQEMAEGRFDYLRWFPQGAKAHLFTAPGAVTTAPKTVLTAYVEGTWLPQKEPLVRKWAAITYRKHWRKHIKPAFGARPLTAITTAALRDFRTALTAPEPRGKGLKVKTARDIIDATFRAIYRDARKVDKIVTGDPFADLDWPRKVVPKPDPYTAEERDLLLKFFWQRKRHQYAFVYVLFFVGLRTAEAIGLRWGKVDLRRGHLTIDVSRTLGEDNAPKTAKSQRTIPLRSDVVAVLRELRPLHVTEHSFVFTTEHGTPLNEERFVESHWRPALRATGIRPRKFYATRATFITQTLEAGTSTKKVADYCGTSVSMIEQHYADWMAPTTPAELAVLGGSPPRLSRVVKAV
jgi:integrase